MNNYNHIESSSYQVITEVCRDAYRNNLFVGIVGESGWGKSFGFSKFKEKNPHVFVDEITPSMDAGVLYQRVIKEFGNQEYKSTKLYHTIEKASTLINRIESNSLFIIDEAGNFKISMHRYIREFRDRVKNSSGIIISGPKSFYNALHNNRTKFGIQEVLTRIDYWIFLEEPTIDEFVAICQANGIKDESIVLQLIDGCQDFRTLRNRIFNLWRQESSSSARATA